MSRHGLTVIFNMGFGCFRSVVHGVLVVAAGQVGVMCRGLMFSRFMVLTGFLVVSCGVLHGARPPCDDVLLLSWTYVFLP
ncbi:MAG TPA: hypothetical protein VGH37_09000 [Candidatus Acidoferrum sp.]